MSVPSLAQPFATRTLLALALLPACSQPSTATVPLADTPRAPAAAPGEVGGPAPAPVHGRVSVEHGQTVLRVWGTPHEMGYAHGTLLREAILAVIDGYALTAVPATTLAVTAAALNTVGSIAPALREEAQGMIDGMSDHGGTYVTGLGRELTAGDLLALNAMTDLVAIGCSSVSSWGDGVAVDQGGAPMVVRNLDWSRDADLLAHQVVLVTMPSDPNRQPVVSVGFAGYIACLSCMNEAGVTALFNMGHGKHPGSIAQASAGFAPANLLIRDALERRDVDGDGRSSADDLGHAIRQARHIGSYIVHVVEPRGHGTPARVFEVESDGVAERTADAGLGPERLAATNHLRKKTEPSACSRYDRIERVSAATARFDRDSLWALGRALRLDDVVYTVLMEPERRAFRLWLRPPGGPAGATERGVGYGWEALVVR